MEIPGYKIERELGRGGMATVYLAVQESVSRDVALKVMSPVLQADRTFGERFMREARIAANLHHRNVVAIHDVGVHDDFHYIAMEYLPGGELKSRLGGKCDAVQTLRIIREIADALNYAHARGYIHRDIKPDNILFREDGSSVLTDFGIARATNSATQMTRTGAVVGTPHYMSPEQARGKPIDHRADLYSLGIVFHEILTGAVPYEADDSLAVGIKHITEPIPKLPETWAQYQPMLDKLLAKDPELRYQSGAELVRDLRAYEAIARSNARRTPPIDAPLPDAPSVEPETRAMRTPSGDYRRLTPTADETEQLQSPGDDTTARMHTPPAPTARMQTPAGPTQRMPTPESQPTLVTDSDTPGGRIEPVFGSVDGLSVNDDFAARRGGSSRVEKRSALPWIILAALVLIAAAGWWFREPIAKRYHEYQTVSLLGKVESALVSGRLLGDEGAVTNIQALREHAPDDPRTQSVLRAVVDRLAGAARADQAAGRRVFANQKIELLATLDAEHQLVVAEQQPEEESRSTAAAPGVLRTNPAADAARLLGLARDAEARGQWLSEDGTGAVDYYKETLVIAPNNLEAKDGLSRAAQSFRADIEATAQADGLAAAEAKIARLARVDASMAAEVRAEIETIREAEAANERRRQQVERLLSRAQSALRAGRLLEPADSNALSLYQEALDLEPTNDTARSGVETVSRRLLARIGDALEEDELARAEQDLMVADSLLPSDARVARLRERLERYRRSSAEVELSPAQAAERDQLLARAEEALARGDFMSPPGASSFDYYKAIFALDRNNQAAAAGIQEVGRRLVERAEEAMATGNLGRARVDLNNARQTTGVETQVARLSLQLAEAYLDEVESAIADNQLDRAEEALGWASELDPTHPSLEPLQLQISMARE